MPTSDKVPLLNRYRKIGKIFCNDFRCKSLICRSLTFKCLLVTQLLIIPLQREVITPTVTELNNDSDAEEAPSGNDTLNMVTGGVYQ